MDDFLSLYDPDRGGLIERFWNISQPRRNGKHALVQFLISSLESGKFRNEVSNRMLKCVLSEQIDIEVSKMRDQGVPLDSGQKYRTFARDLLWPERKDALKRYDNAGQKWRQFEPGLLIGFGGCSINNMSVCLCHWLDSN